MIFALQTSSEAHLGFVLFADAETGEDSGDCVVRPLPQDSALLDSPEYNLLSDFRDAGELRFRFEDGKNKLYIGDDSFGLHFDRSMSGNIYSEKKSGLPIFGLLVEDEEE